MIPTTTSRVTAVRVPLDAAGVDEPAVVAHGVGGARGGRRAQPRPRLLLNVAVQVAFVRKLGNQFFHGLMKPGTFTLRVNMGSRVETKRFLWVSWIRPIQPPTSRRADRMERISRPASLRLAPSGRAITLCACAGGGLKPTMLGGECAPTTLDVAVQVYPFEVKPANLENHRFSPLYRLKG
jgi:hypothetical protein